MMWGDLLILKEFIDFYELKVSFKLIFGVNI